MFGAWSAMSRPSNKPKQSRPGSMASRAAFSCYVIGGCAIAPTLARRVSFFLSMTMSLPFLFLVPLR